MALKNRLIVLFLAFVFLFQQTLPSYACGPFFPDAIFSFTNHPDLPLKKFAQGNLGILQPGLAMSYLVVAYRYLANNPLDSGEQNAVISLWHRRLQYLVDYNSSLVKPWVAVRNTVPGVKKLQEYDISPYKYVPETYQEHTYCTPSTFIKAANTLKGRITKYGINSAQVKFWVDNQDIVFQNCSSPEKTTILPKPPLATADSLSKDDYAYQLAAANFYAENFDVACGQFEQISKNPQSPWQKLSAYLVARIIFLQNIDLKVSAEKTEKQLQTEQYLLNALKESGLTDYQDDIKKLINALEFKLHPMQRYHQLVQAVMQPNSGSTLEQDLDDFTIMLDSFLASPDSQSDLVNGQSVKQMHDEAIKDDLTNWIFAFGAKDENVSLKKWQSTKSIPWLIAALSSVSENNQSLSELLAAAEKIPQNSPAYLTVQYYAITALIKAHEENQAKQNLDRLLGQNLSCMTPSAHNMLLAQRQKLASSLWEYIQYALKRPVCGATIESYRCLPDEDFDKIEKLDNYLQPLPATFDGQMAEAINKYFPLSLWKELVANKKLSTKLHNELLASTWVRAILLNDNKTADTYTPMLQSAYPAISSFLASYKSAQDPIEKRFAACYVLVKALGFSPYIRGLLGRTESNILQRDEYGDNFWVPLDPDENKEKANNASDAEGDPAVIFVHLSKFLTDQEKGTAQREAKILYTTSSPPKFITEAIFAMAKRKSNDARIPEALFVATKMPRWGVRLPDSTEYSKAAFKMLHSKYAQSKWAKRAQYYY